MSVRLVFFCDGSCRGNPGYAGSGVFGYSYRESKRAKNHKHPARGSLYFTPNGVVKEKSSEPIEVLEILENIKSINKSDSTNNEAELLAILTAMEKADGMEIEKLTIFTDSRYIVTAFNENMEKWKTNNWRRIDNKPIVHLREWKLIDEYHRNFTERGIEVSINWVKGHSGDYGNTMADIYSVIGSNAARKLFNSELEEEAIVVLDRTMSYSEYKKSFEKKDFVFHFRNLYFSSDKLDDVNYCFLATSEDDSSIGKRNVSTIFATNVGYVPPVVNKIKEFYRSIERDYTINCYMKISKLNNPDIYRLVDALEIEYLLVKLNDNNSYSLVGDHTPFLFENTINLPFIVNASKLFSKMVYIDSIKNEDISDLMVFDITDDVVEDKKLKISNKDKFMDFTEKVKDSLRLKQKLLVKVGYDIPNYLALKGLEGDIERVYLILESNPENNFCSLYTNIITSSRSIYSINVENKYLKLS